MYNETYENLGECLHSLYLGCKHCKNCSVEEYFTKQKSQRELENKKEQEMYEELYGDIEWE